ncbi:MAG: hypothetical protein J6Y91_03900 [Alphaproteobacteria bacterium]|nr:hypothetical protein [Alphaproteobacteria bacterium]
MLFFAASAAQAQVCTPGETSEKAGIPLICNEDGSGWEMLDYDGDETTMDDGMTGDEYGEEQDEPFDFEAYIGNSDDNIRTGNDYTDNSYQGGSNEGMDENDGDNGNTGDKKEILISSTSETECSGNDCAPGGGGTGGSGGSGGGDSVEDAVSEQAAALEKAADKATPTSAEEEKEDKPKKEVDPVFNNRYLIPMVMAEYCEISASEIVEDINVLHDCVRKYVAEIHNEDTNATFEGGKDLELLQYKLLIDNIVWAFRTSLTIAHYEEMQNKQAEARSKGSTQRDMEAGMSSSKAFSINVVNNIIDTTADYLKYRTLSRMTLIDPSVFEEDETESTSHVEYFDGYAELWSNDGKLIGTYNPTSMNSPATTEGGLGADVTTAKATVETNEMVDDNAMGLMTNENKIIGGESLGACVITEDMVIQKGEYKNVGDEGENIYLGCNEDGSVVLTSKKEDGSFAEGVAISLDQAQTMLDTVNDVNDMYNDIVGSLGGGSGGGSDDAAGGGEGGTDDNGGEGGGSDDAAGGEGSGSDDATGGEEGGSEDDGNDSDSDDDSDENQTDEDKKDEEDKVPVSTVEYTGVYKGRQLYPDIMAFYCEINAEDMSLDITQIEDCLLKYIKAMHDEDTIKSDAAHKDYLALKAAALMSVKSQAETKQGNIENFRTSLAEKYEKAANTSDNSQGDNMVIAETEAFLTDVINALREMYIERMKYESINNVENVNLETALAAQPQGTMLETVVVTGNK